MTADTAQPPPRVPVELPLVLLVRLADGDGKMTARQMERYEALLARRDWCRSELFRSGLAAAEAGRDALWKRYVAGDLRAGPDDVAAAVQATLAAVAADQQPALETDLLYFCGQLLRAARGGAWALRRDSPGRAAFDELAALIRRPSARASQQAQLQALVEPQAPRPNFGALLKAEINPGILWEGGRLRLRCVQVVDETPDIRTFRFAADPVRLFRYYPGQFMTLELSIDGQTVRRSYSISTSPSRPQLIAVTVKRVEGGQVSNWLHDHIAVGTVVMADGPFGKFTCIGDTASRHLFISGGSGVTPVMAMARWLCDTTPDADVVFLHFARTPADIAFEHELRLIERNTPGFRCVFVCSRVDAAAGWSGRTGRISAELLADAVPDMMERSVYLCGPVPFMESARTILGQVGFDLARFKQESFGAAPRDAAAAAAQSQAVAHVDFAASKVGLDCTSADYILDLALANGVAARFSCRAGQCGTCKVALVEGRVEHDVTDGLTADDAQAGLILACQARPVGRVVVEL